MFDIALNAAAIWLSRLLLASLPVLYCEPYPRANWFHSYYTTILLMQKIKDALQVRHCTNSLELLGLPRARRNCMQIYLITRYSVATFSLYIARAEETNTYFKAPSPALMEPHVGFQQDFQNDSCITLLCPLSQRAKPLLEVPGSLNATVEGSGAIA